MNYATEFQRDAIVDEIDKLAALVDTEQGKKNWGLIRKQVNFKTADIEKLQSLLNLLARSVDTSALG